MVIQASLYHFRTFFILRHPRVQVPRFWCNLFEWSMTVTSWNDNFQHKEWKKWDAEGLAPIVKVICMMTHDQKCMALHFQGKISIRSMLIRFIFFRYCVYMLHFLFLSHFTQNSNNYAPTRHKLSNAPRPLCSPPNQMT